MVRPPRQTNASRRPSAESAQPRETSKSQTERHSKFGQLSALITAVGTLLAGIAATLAVFLSGTSSTPSQQTPTGAVSDPAPPIAGFSGLATRVIDLARPFLLVTANEYSAFTSMSSEHGSIRLDVPAEWADRKEVPWSDDNGNIIGSALEAAELVTAIWDDPPKHGLFIGVSSASPDPEAFLDTRRPDRISSCQQGEEGGFLGDRLRGTYRIWLKCGTTSPGSAILELAANEVQTGKTVVLFIRITESRDLLALRSAMDSLTVDPILAPFVPNVYPAPLEVDQGTL